MIKQTDPGGEEKQKNLWNKCPSCDQIIYKKDLEENFKICPKCGHYLRMSAVERIEMFADKNDNGSVKFTELDAHLCPMDPLEFSSSSAVPAQTGKGPVKDKLAYAFKLTQEQKKTAHRDAAVCGETTIGRHRVVISVINFEFMGGSMGSVVGEKVTRAAERSLELKVPLILISSSGGARMQEGILSLMQMAKTSAAIAKLHESKVLVLSILCDPTTGGVTASFATLGDILIGEPKALIAFAGPRVIEQTIRQKLPEGFQQSEFLMKHGMIDCIVERKKLKSEIISFLNIFTNNPSAAKGSKT